MNAHETYQPPASSYTEIADIVTSMQRESAKQLEWIRSMRRQVELDELADAGFEPLECAACGNPTEGPYVKYCDYCRDEDQSVKDEIEEDFALNEADRMNDQAVERELA